MLNPTGDLIQIFNFTFELIRFIYFFGYIYFQLFFFFFKHVLIFEKELSHFSGNKYVFSFKRLYVHRNSLQILASNTIFRSKENLNRLFNDDDWIFVIKKMSGNCRLSRPLDFVVVVANVS